jgi:hypothetical protein
LNIKALLVFLFLPSLLISRNISLEIESFSVGGYGLFSVKNFEPLDGSLDFGAPTLYINENNTKLTLFLQPGKISLNDNYINGYLYHPVITGIRWEPLEYRNMSLGPYTRVSIDSSAKLYADIGFYYHATIPIWEEIGYIESIGLRAFDLYFGYDIINNAFALSMTMDPGIAILYFSDIYYF